MGHLLVPLRYDLVLADARGAARAPRHHVGALVEPALLPAALEEGPDHIVVLGGEGEVGEAGPGDLYVQIHIFKHPKFDRHGSDLYVIKEISFPEAALGTKIDVETIDGRNGKLRIPEGTQNGSVFKIKGKGMPDLHGRGYGNLFVEASIKTPKNLSRKAKKLLEEFKNAMKNYD